MFAAGAGNINPVMASATCLPPAHAFRNADPFSASIAQDTLELAVQLAEAIQILDQCHARAVIPSDEFLDYVDGLTTRVESIQVDHTVHRA